MKQPMFRSALAFAAVTLAALALIPLAAARIDRQAAATATTVEVKGGEFFSRTSATFCTTSRSTARRRP
jgi:hypothetical protein